MKNQIYTKNSNFLSLILLILIIGFIFACCCEETAVRGGEAVAEAGSKSRTSSNLIVPAIRGAVGAGNAINANSDVSETLIPITSELKIIPYNSLQSYLLAGDAGYQFNIDVTSTGGPVDILIFDENNYLIYANAFKSGSNAGYAETVYRKVHSQNFEYILPSQGKYYLVIENPWVLSIGTPAKNDVIVNTVIELVK